MVQMWIVVAPRTKLHKSHLKQIIKCNDCKRWIIARETGKDGYEHWQCRMESSNPNFFSWMRKHFPFVHVEKASGTDFVYERKEGYFWTSEDRTDVRAIRFGKPTELQRRIIRTADTQGDRGITVILDPKGGHGKSWLAIHLWETGRALTVPRSEFGPADMSAFICSTYRSQEYIIVDIPRAKKIPPTIYEIMEEIKDGLVYDKRYSGKIRNIRGVKIIVFTNTPLDTTKLSKDRWHLYGISEHKDERGALFVTLAGSGSTWSYKTNESRGPIGKRIQT